MNQQNLEEKLKIERTRIIKEEGTFRDYVRYRKKISYPLTDHQRDTEKETFNEERKEWIKSPECPKHIREKEIWGIRGGIAGAISGALGGLGLGLWSYIATGCYNKLINPDWKNVEEGLYEIHKGIEYLTPPFNISLGKEFIYYSLGFLLAYFLLTTPVLVGGIAGYGSGKVFGKSVSKIRQLLPTKKKAKENYGYLSKNLIIM